MHIRHRIQSTATELIVAAVSAALIVVVPAPLLAQQKATAVTAHAAKPVIADEEEESTPASKKPGDNGIKVHGHWIIDVKDKDGKPSSTATFRTRCKATVPPHSDCF